MSGAQGTINGGGLPCRGFLCHCALAATVAGLPAHGAESPARKTRVTITLDLEMWRNFPRWEQTHWDYEKGNFDEAARRVEAHGGVVHFFLVGRALEQENVD